MSVSGSRLATSARARRWVAVASAVSGAAAPIAFALHATVEGWPWLAIGTAFAVAAVFGVGALVLSFAYESLQRIKHLEVDAGRSRARLTEVGDDLAYQRSRTSEIDARIVGIGAEIDRSSAAAREAAASTAQRLADVEALATATASDVKHSAAQLARGVASIGAVQERLPRVEEAIRKDVAAARADIAAQDRLTRNLDRAARTSADSLWRQMEGLVGLYATLQPRKPIPPTRGWAMSPDILSFIISEVLVRDRASVLEFGSGVSTLLMALAMERRGSGTIVSVDHDEVFGAQTAALLESFGLSHRAEVCIAPLTDMEIAGETRHWYDATLIPTDREVDLVTVDGPPWVEGTLARYPALPVVHDLLVPGGMIVLDDADRDAEKEIAERWRTEFPDVSFRVLNHEKGTLVGERVAGG